jgi:hypothetical protein
MAREGLGMGVGDAISVSLTQLSYTNGQLEAGLTDWYHKDIIHPDVIIEYTSLVKPINKTNRLITHFGDIVVWNGNGTKSFREV